MKKQVKVVMLPTEKAKIHKHNVNNILITSVENIEASELYNTTPQHLYFLSDEEIKEGDWFYNPHSGHIHKAGTHSDLITINNNKCKKIITTTDESLITAIDGYRGDLLPDVSFDINLPRPSNEFIKKYCELGGIDEVLVQYEDYLINPLTEQEVSITDTIAAEDLDTGYRLKVASDNTIAIYPIK